MLLFADDTESPDDMQNLLDGLKAYCNKWNISVNTEKTKVVVFKSGNRRSNVELYFDNLGDNAVTSLIRIAQVFPELVGKTLVLYERLVWFKHILFNK